MPTLWYEANYLPQEKLNMEASKPILIVGAGVSGLTLAQGLRKAGLRFKVFESDLSTSFRTQGYRIRIKGDGLQACLSPELWAKFQDSCGQPPKNVSRINAITAETLPFGFGLPKGPPPMGNTFTTDRTVLRDLLLEGLEDSVLFGHKLRKFDISDEAVVAHFENGTSYEGSMLIAADGGGSIVRRQHLPQHRLLDTGIRCIYGKTLLTEELLQAFPAMAEPCAFIGVDELNTNGKQLAIFVETMRFQENEMRADLPHDYVYWVVLGDQDFFLEPDQSLLSLTGTDAAQLSGKITEHWHESIKSLLKFQDSKRTAALRVSTAPPEIPPWEASSRITFVGDAIHLMPPTGGIGANTALQDVAALVKILVEDGIAEGSIKRYEDDMRRRASEAIEQSLQGAKHMVGLGHWSSLKHLDA